MDGNVYICDHFDALATFFSDGNINGKSPVADGYEGLADVVVIHAIELTAQTGLPQTIELPARTVRPSAKTVRIVDLTNRRLLI